MHTIYQRIICERSFTDHQLLLRTSRGNEFNKNSVNRILRNKRYIGYYLYKGKETPGGMPRIIDDDLFFQAQNLLEKNKMAPGRTHGKGEYLLTTKFICSHCKALMTGFCGTSHTQRVYHYYICSNAKLKKCNSIMVSKQIIEDTVITACVAFLNHDTIDHIADKIYQACQDDSNIASIKKLNVRLIEIERAIENLWNALEQGDAAERITKRINAREEEKADIERQLAIERRKIKSFDYPRIHAFLGQMKSLNCANISDRVKMATMFIHTIYYYEDYVIIIMNGGKGLVTSENIPINSIVNSINNRISGTFSGSPVCQSAPP